MVVPFKSDGVFARIFSWMDDHHLLVMLPVIGIISSICVFCWAGVRPDPVPEPISHAAQNGDYCYIDAQLLSDWILKVSDGEETLYYLTTDFDNNHYIVTMYDSQFNQLSDIVEFTRGNNTENVPDARRVDGIIKPLRAEEAASLAEALGITSEEFETIFENRFVDLQEDPETIVVGGFIWVLGISILLLLLRGIAAFDEFTERRKQREQAVK